MAEWITRETATPANGTVTAPTTAASRAPPWRRLSMFKTAVGSLKTEDFVGLQQIWKNKSHPWNITS